MFRRLACLSVTLALVATACGGGDATEEVATTVPTTTATTAAVVTTTSTVAPTTLATTTTTTTQAPTAADSLADYLVAVDELFGSAETAALMFNISWQTTNSVDDSSRAAIEALDATPLRSLIPAGLDPDVETAALAVFADLDSMVSALHGAVRFENAEDDLQFCVGAGFTSLERFDDDRQTMLDLAAEAPAPTAAADSEEAGILAVRLETIQSMNWGCDSCGGVAYDEPIPVDWAGNTVLDGVGFEAEFTNGMWAIMIFAC